MSPGFAKEHPLSTVVSPAQVAIAFVVAAIAGIAALLLATALAK